jgi:hypothetical protein
MFGPGPVWSIDYRYENNCNPILNASFHNNPICQRKEFTEGQKTEAFDTHPLVIIIGLCLIFDLILNGSCLKDYRGLCGDVDGRRSRTKNF